jgi:C4-dicarboxylate-binding protein DctP
MTTLVRIAGYQDETSVHTRAVRVLERTLKERSGGAIEVEFEPDVARQGRKVAGILGDVEAGALDLCYFSSSYLTERVPALGIFDIPFELTDPQRTRALLDGPLGALIAEHVASRTGYRVLGFWDNGLRNISNGVRPIRTPADCVGLRIRTLPSPGYIAAFRALGMTPVHVDIRDLVRAIRDGEVDAQENPLANIKLFGLHQYHRFATLTRHFHGIALVLCNAAAWSRWSHEVHEVFEAAVAAATAAQWTSAAAEEATSRQILEAEGMSVIELDVAGREAFRTAVRALVEQQYAALPAELRSLAMTTRCGGEGEVPRSGVHDCRA